MHSTVMTQRPQVATDPETPAELLDAIEVQVDRIRAGHDRPGQALWLRLYAKRLCNSLDADGQLGLTLCPELASDRNDVADTKLVA